MRLFNENLTLRRIEEILSDQLKDVRIIGELPISYKDFEYLAGKVRVFIQNNAENELFSKYRASLATFLVFSAVYNYEGRAYWPYIERYTGEIYVSRRSEFYQHFLYILDQLNLPKFEKEKEEGYKYVTPIICHAGIPQSCLDDYFDVVNDTLNNTAFFEGHILDEFKYFMRYKVQKPIIRYFDFLGNQAEQFLQNSRDLLLYCDSGNVSLEEASTKFSELPIRMIERCFVWQNSEKAKEKIKTRKNVTLTTPKIMLDMNGFGIYAMLPQQLVKECFNDSVSWEISCGDKITTVKAQLFKKGEYFTSDEKTVILTPGAIYKISFFVEDKPIGVWEFRGLSDGYICFDHNGNLIRKSYLPPDTVVVIFDKKNDIMANDAMIEEIPCFPNWTNYKTYRINLERSRDLICSFGNLEIRRDNRPILSGGKKLFEQTEGIGANCYTELPYIVINDGKDDVWHITIALKHENHEIDFIRNNVPTGLERVPLENFIPRNSFGEYDITIWGSLGTQGRFFIKYVPQIEFYHDIHTFWPTGTKGYTNNEFFCRYSQGVSLGFENAIDVGEVVINSKDYNKYVLNGVGRFIYGKLTFISNNYQYSVPIKKSIRPIMWGYMGLKDDASVTWVSSPRTFSIRDLQNYSDPNLVISIDDCGHEKIILRIILISNENRVINTRVIHAENNSNNRIPLNTFLTDMLVSEANNFNLILQICSLEEEKISECVVAKIQEDLVYSDLTASVDEPFMRFSWEEKGNKADRELVLYNCYIPWELPKVYPIENGQCVCKVDLTSLQNSMYAAKIRSIDNFSFFNIDLEIPKMVSMKRFIAGSMCYELSVFNSILSDLFKSAYKGKQDINYQKLASDFVPDNVSENIEALCISYLFFIKNSIKDENKKINITKVLKRFINLLSQEKYKVLKVLLNMEIKREDFIRLAQEFNLLCIKLERTSTFTPIERDKLWNYMPELAFVVDIQIKINAGRICNWIGDSVINGIVQIKKECSIRDCLSKLLAGECKCDQIVINMNEDVLGSSKYRIGFFEYLSKEYYSAKRLEKLDNSELFRAYENQNGNKELRVFGKSYFYLVQEWTCKVENEERKKIEDTLKKMLEEAVDEEFIKRNYPIIYKTLCERSSHDYKLEFYIGMIVFMSALCRDDIAKYQWSLEKSITYIHRKYKPLLLRDLVIFELFILFGGVR